MTSIKTAHFHFKNLFIATHFIFWSGHIIPWFLIKRICSRISTDVIQYQRSGYNRLQRQVAEDDFICVHCGLCVPSTKNLQSHYCFGICRLIQWRRRVALISTLILININNLLTYLIKIIPIKRVRVNF